MFDADMEIPLVMRRLASGSSGPYSSLNTATVSVSPSLAKKYKSRVDKLREWVIYLHCTKSTCVKWMELKEKNFDWFKENSVYLQDQGKNTPLSGFTRLSSQVKLDIKLYPILNGALVKWMKFKHGVLAIAIPMI